MARKARIKTRFEGVYSRTFEDRRVGGKPDVCFDITFRHNGKFIWEKVGFASEGVTARHASLVRAKRLDALQSGQLVMPGKAPTLAEIWEEYFENVLSSKRNSGYREAIIWRKHVPESMKLQRLSAIQPSHLDAIVTAMRRKNYAPQTITHVLSVVGRLFNRAKRKRLWSGESPLTGVDRPTVENKRLRWLTPDEAEALLNELQQRSIAIWRMAFLSLHSGLRAGEIFALQGQDVLLEAQRIAVRPSTAKTGVARHAIITEACARMLNEVVLLPGRLVFPGRGGVQRREMSDTYARAVDALGLNAGVTDRLQEVVFHTLRHTYASWLAQAGVPLYMVAQLMGQTTEQVTARYAHLCPDGMSAAVLKVPTFMQLSAALYLPATSVRPRGGT